MNEDTTRRTIRLPHDFTVAQLRTKLEGIPDTAKVSAQFTPGDRPFDPDEHRLVFEWTERG